MDYKLEICVDSIESAMTAQVAGAARIELCSGLVEGGITPSYGTITAVRDNLSIELNVIIRPRGGDFMYTDSEYDVMRRDIEMCGEAGVNGIVLGILRRDGSVDIERTQMLITLAHPMSVTFHRAFDMCSDPFKGLENVISAGATRVLTSGQKGSAVEGMDLIQKLVVQGGKRIIIMAGGGIDAVNIGKVARGTGVQEFHLTAGKMIESDMTFTRKGISMGGVAGIPEYSRKVADPDKIKTIADILRMI